MQVEAPARTQGIPLGSPCSGAPARRPACHSVSRPAPARITRTTLSASRRAVSHRGAACLAWAEMMAATASCAIESTATAVRRHSKPMGDTALTSDPPGSFCCNRLTLPTRITGERQRLVPHCAALGLSGTSDRWTCCMRSAGKTATRSARLLHPSL